MRILILGGTRFVGRHITEACVAAAHEVWLGNRGRTTPDTYGAAGRLRIDRDRGDLDALRDEAFDAVLDVSAYVPRHVHEVAAAIGGLDRYLLISSVSAYDAAHLSVSNDEATPLLAPRHDTEDASGEAYGALKAACEQVAADRFGDRSVIVRPGVVAGPHDPTDRFTWWTRQFAGDDPVALPDRREAGPLHDDVQVVDARDLAAFCLRLAATSAGGAFDVTGHVRRTADFAHEVRSGVGGTAEVDWVAAGDWSPDHLPPLLLHPSWNQDGLFSRTSARARAAGLVTRPVSETAADTRAWDLARGSPPLRAG